MFSCALQGAKQIKKCGDIVARDYGDAQTEIKLLYFSGLLAQKEGSKTVEERHVDLALNIIEIDGNIQMIRHYTPSCRWVLEAIAITVRDRSMRTTNVASIISTYNKFCEKKGIKPVKKSRISQIISDLTDRGLISTTSKQESDSLDRSVTLLFDPVIFLYRLEGKEP